MQISRVTIIGMHNVTNVTYDLNQLNYLFGSNGAGKSTVLQAIQLAILGYIPGTDKNKTAIFRHANGNTMSVYVQFDNGVSIYRLYQQTGKEIKATVQISPDTVDMATVLNGMELPIFDFNEFIGMTANKLKDWFINFLPQDDTDIDWNTELVQAYPLIENTQPELIEETINTINCFGGGQLDKVRKFNEYCKAQMLEAKATHTRLTDTMQSFIHYDDFKSDMTVSELEQTIAATEQGLQDIRKDITIYETNSKQIQTINMIAERTGCKTESAYEEKIKYYDTTIEGMQAALTLASAEVNSIESAIREAKNSIVANEKILSGHGFCQYTGVACNEMLQKLPEIQKEVDKTKADINELNLKLAEVKGKYETIAISIQEQRSYRNQLVSDYNVFKLASNSIDVSKMTDIGEMKEIEQKLVVDLARCRDELTKLKANEDYNKLKDKITIDIMSAAQKLDIYKAWDKLTSVNGLQSRIMIAPFEKFSENITYYLQQFFGDPSISAKFYVGEKANSFSFGVVRNDKYIEYDLLSSGEKCIYTLSLLTAVVSASSSQLKLILIDDLLDHLDDARITDCFRTLYNNKAIQTILAGVKPCTHENAGEFVINL